MAVNGQSPTKTADGVPIFNVNTPTDEIIAGLGEVGGCVIKDFVNSDIIQKLNNDFLPLLEAEQERWSGKWFQTGWKKERESKNILNWPLMPSPRLLLLRRLPSSLRMLWQVACLC